jgi:hypothetical protein
MNRSSEFSAACDDSAGSLEVADELQSSSTGAAAGERSAERVPEMAEQLQISPPAWALVDMLQQQLGVRIEVLDVTLRPLKQSGAAELSTGDDKVAVAELHRSLRTGELRVDRSSGTPIGIFPIRSARQIAGCVVVSAQRSRGPDGRREGEAFVEAAGHLARTAIEADLVLTSQLTDARHRARRVHGILRFLTQLGGADTPDIMNAVVQAATLWFDVDCRIYQREGEDGFVLAAVLPGVEARHAGTRLDPARVDRLLSLGKFSSAGDLEDLGLGLIGRQQEVLVIPVGKPAAPDWILVLAGAIDREVELTFSAVARVLGGDLLAREAARVDTWRERLRAAHAGPQPVPERVLLDMLERLASDVNAAAATLVLRKGGHERVLAALGPAQGERNDGPESPVAAQQYALPIGGDTVLSLTISTAVVARQVECHAASWLKSLETWLPDALARMAKRESLFEPPPEQPPFERRMQEEVERAKRFNLGLGLVVIGPIDGAGAGDAELLAAVRSELRASDLMGRIRDGLVAVLLVHAEPVGIESVIDRLRQRFGLFSSDLRASMTTPQVGRAVFSADCASADALITLALRHVQSLESRN